MHEDSFHYFTFIKNQIQKIEIQNYLPITRGEPTQIQQHFQKLIHNSLKFKESEISPVNIILVNKSLALGSLSDKFSQEIK